MLPEIVNLIIGFCDFETLKSWRAVSKTCEQMCRPHFVRMVDWSNYTKFSNDLFHERFKDHIHRDYIWLIQYAKRALDCNQYDSGPCKLLFVVKSREARIIIKDAFRYAFRYKRFPCPCLTMSNLTMHFKDFNSPTKSTALIVANTSYLSGVHISNITHLIFMGRYEQSVIDKTTQKARHITRTVPFKVHHYFKCFDFKRHK